MQEFFNETRALKMKIQVPRQHHVLQSWTTVSLSRRSAAPMFFRLCRAAPPRRRSASCRAATVASRSWAPAKRLPTAISFSIAVKPGVSAAIDQIPSGSSAKEFTPRLLLTAVSVLSPRGAVTVTPGSGEPAECCQAAVFRRGQSCLGNQSR